MLFRSFQNSGWQLLVNQSIDGANIQSTEFDIPAGPMSKYIRFRYTSTVGNQGFQLIELELSGYGALTN